MGNLRVNIIVAITILWIKITSCLQLTTKYTQRENPSKDEVGEDNQHVSINIDNLKDMELLDNTHIFGPKADIVYGPNTVKTVEDLLKASRRHKFHPYWNIPNKITRTQQDKNKMRKKGTSKTKQKNRFLFTVRGDKRGGNKIPPSGYRGSNKRPPSGYRGGNKRPQPRPNKRPPCKGKLCKYKKESDRMKPVKELEDNILKQLEDVSVEFRVDPNYNQDGDYPDMGQALAGYQFSDDYGGIGWDASEYFPLKGLLHNWPSLKILPYYPPEGSRPRFPIGSVDYSEYGALSS